MSKIDVILLEDVRGSGKKGEKVSVAKGYARNCLIPKKLARVADKAAIMELEAQHAADERRQAEELAHANEVKGIIDGQSVDVYAVGGENGKLFGSVTPQDIADAINQKFKTDVDKRKIRVLIDDLKVIDSFGTYPYEVRLHAGVVAKINVNVIEKEENK